MKMGRKIAALLTASVLAGSFAFADSDALNNATSGAVKDDASYFMDVLDFSKLDFNNFYALTTIDSSTTANLGYAQKLNGNMLQAAWDGNLWSNDAENTLSVLYGMKGLNLGVKGSLYLYTPSSIVQGAQTYSNYVEYKPSVSAGYYITPQIGVYGTFTYAGANASKTSDHSENANYNVYSYNKSAPVIAAGAFYTFKDSSSFVSKAGLEYSGTFTHVENATTTYTYNTDTSSYTSKKTETATSESENVITPSYLMQYKFGKNFTYGLYAYAPVTISHDNNGTSDDTSDDTDTTTVGLFAANGISAELVPGKLLANFGILTELPSIDFEKDSDASTGTITNTFSAGLSVYLTPEVRLDGWAEITPATGVSLNDVWEQNFNLSLQAKF